MNTKDAIEQFGSIKELAKALGITQPAIYQWGDKVPELRAYQIAEMISQRTTEQKAA
jgi:DNA-binding transcriptional regulator YdaS (Cro superfamily)